VVASTITTTTKSPALSRMVPWVNRNNLFINAPGVGLGRDLLIWDHQLNSRGKYSVGELVTDHLNAINLGEPDKFVTLKFGTHLIVLPSFLLAARCPWLLEGSNQATFCTVAAQLASDALLIFRRFLFGGEITLNLFTALPIVKHHWTTNKDIESQRKAILVYNDVMVRELLFDLKSELLPVHIPDPGRSLSVEGIRKGLHFLGYGLCATLERNPTPTNSGGCSTTIGAESYICIHYSRPKCRCH